MSGEMEAVGAVTEGALVARAVEDEAGENSTAGHGACLNCAAILAGPYCTQCGQAAHVHRSLAAFGHDIVHSVWHFDGKLWRTLPLLAWQPGVLTRRYIHGERAKFVSPMALFLFTIFLTFAIFAAIGGKMFGGTENAVLNGQAIAARSELTAEIRKLDTELAEQKQILAATASEAEQASLRAEIARLQQDRTAAALVLDGSDGLNALKNANGRANVKADTGSPWLDAQLNKGIAKATGNPSLLLYKLQSSGYKFAWLLIPISIPFLWLLMIGRPGLHMYDHAVFATYSISFQLLLLLAALVVESTGTVGGWILTFWVLYAPFHLYRQLRHAYGLSRAGAIVRLFFLLIFIIWVLTIFALLLLTMGLLG